MPLKKKTQTTIIDLRKELLIQIDGKEEQNHIIKWDILKAIGDATQNLIYKLAKYSLEDKTLPPEALKLEFIGFHEGSAIPDWRLPASPNLLFNSDRAYKELNQKFSSVVASISDGNFQKIADAYNEPSVKNEIIEAVYEFSNAGDGKPVNIVTRLSKPVGKKHFSPIAKVRPMAFKVKGYLRVQEPEINFAIEEQEIDAYGKFKLKTSKSGRKSKSNLYLYTEKEATLSLSYDSIETDKRIYVFHTYVLFAFTEDAKTHHVNIENQLLDIYAFGANMNEAKQDLFEQFDYTYRRLNQFSNKKLSSHLLDAKTYINLIVDKIKEK